MDFEVLSITDVRHQSAERGITRRIECALELSSGRRLWLGEQFLLAGDYTLSGDIGEKAEKGLIQLVRAELSITNDTAWLEALTNPDYGFKKPTQGACGVALFSGQTLHFVVLVSDEEVSQFLAAALPTADMAWVSININDVDFHPQMTNSDLWVLPAQQEGDRWVSDRRAITAFTWRARKMRTTHRKLALVQMNEEHENLSNSKLPISQKIARETEESLIHADPLVRLAKSIEMLQKFILVALVLIAVLMMFGGLGTA